MHDAGHNAGHHDKCLLGTRVSVLKDIMDWAKNLSSQNVFWLEGLAGTGKSAIAQSFSEMAASEGFLGASFFCSRDVLNRREPKNIFPTLAYQLACCYPHLRSHIVTSLKVDPSLAHTSPISQFENLIVNPLSGKNISCVIVIDALDECTDDQGDSTILSALSKFARDLPRVKFFITSRPDLWVRTGFRLPLLQPITEIFSLHKVEPSSVDEDIQLYLTQKLTAITGQRSDHDLPNPTPWPCNDEIKALTQKSSGLFIFASTLVKFIGSEYHEPNDRLQLVLSRASGTIHEGYTRIDSLYSQVLFHAFSNVHDRVVLGDVRRVLGAIVLAFNPLSRQELSKILNVETRFILTTLRHLHSVIFVPTDKSQKIRIVHKSFPDFLQDPQRCIDTRFHVDPGAYHSGMALSCLKLVGRLRGNLCPLPPFTMNQDVPNLPQLLEHQLGGAVRYACSYWAGHLRHSTTSGSHTDQVISLATRVLKSAPLWIEVMSLENQLDEVIHSMYGLLDWLNEVSASMLLPIIEWLNC